MKHYRIGGKNGKKIRLVEAEDLLVVRTNIHSHLKHDELGETARKHAESLLPVHSFPESNVMVYRVIPRSGSKKSRIQTRNAIKNELKKEKQVRFAGRTMVDKETGSLHIYTENIFVKFKDELSADACQKIISDHSLAIRQQFRFAPNAFFVKAEDGSGMKVFDISKSLLENPDVEFCHPEIVSEKAAKAIHPMQWHLQQTMINNQVINQHIGAEEAWSLSTGKGVTIAVIDNGVETGHEAFREPGKVVSQRNTFYSTDDGSPSSLLSRQGNHGTACAGVACANAPNDTKGVAPDAKLMPIVCGSLGSMSEASAFEWAADNGADIISCSWGPNDGPWWIPADPSHLKSHPLPDSTRLAIEYATTKGRNGKGCVIVWAAGNGNECVDLDGYASNANVITVSACNDRGVRSVYSDYGNAVWCCFPSDDFEFKPFQHPKPLTPGIWAPDISGSGGMNRGGATRSDSDEDDEGKYTDRFGGTSSSCPGVAGVVALMLSVNPGLRREEIREIIKNACDRIDETAGNYNSDGHSPFYGYGRINAYKAVNLAKETL